MKLLSTRARAQLWRLQAAVRSASKERDRLLRILNSSRAALTADAQRDVWLEYSCADQEYRHAVALLSDFVLKHESASNAGQPHERDQEPAAEN
jgi:hypothetical protein